MEREEEDSAGAGVEVEAGEVQEKTGNPKIVLLAINDD
jgi:hypothetical protein